MRKNNSHIASAIFGLVLLLPLLLLLLLQGWQVVIRYGAERRLETEMLQTITLPLHQVRWEKAGKEISVEGRLFDLKAYHTRAGWLIATGVYDDEETRLADFLYRHAASARDNTSIIHLLVLAQLFVACIRWLPDLLLSTAAPRRYARFVVRCVHPFFTVPVPPPRA